VIVRLYDAILNKIFQIFTPVVVVAFFLFANPALAQDFRLQFIRDKETDFPVFQWDQSKDTFTPKIQKREVRNKSEYFIELQGRYQGAEAVYFLDERKLDLKPEKDFTVELRVTGKHQEYVISQVDQYGMLRKQNLTLFFPAWEQFLAYEQEIDRDTKSKKSIFGFSFNPKINFAVINVSSFESDATGTLISDMGTGCELTWDQRWSSRFKTFVSFEASHLGFRPFSEEIAISNQTQMYTSIGLGFRKRFFSELEVGVQFDLSQQVFYHLNEDKTGVILDKVGISRPKLVLSNRLLRLGSLALNGEIQAYFLLPTSTTNYAVAMGKGIFGNLNLSKRFSPLFEMKVGVFYQTQTQSTTLSGFNRADVGSSLNLVLDLGQ
jgi:hypothetical protein